VRQFNDLTILIVEDNPTIMYLIEQALTKLEVGKVITATTWYQVQQKIDDIHVDGAFLDLVLQHGSGLDIARSLKAIKTPVIFCSGVEDEYNIQQMYAHGFVFAKPVSVPALIRGLEYFRQLKGMK
jgi:CheY-like chemotaxis protein